MKKLGIDIGEKRIGLAISDPTNCIAQPLIVLERKGNFSEMKELQQIIEENLVDEIVVGLPVSMSGKEGKQAQRVKNYISWLKDYVHLSIVEWDERLTTSLAEKVLISADVSRGKRKKVVDKLAAAVILQGYLDSIRAEELKSKK